MPITPLPTPVPSRADPANFAARGDAFLAALPTFAVETEAARVEVNTNATSAAASAAAAMAAQNAATAAVGVTAWVSGTTYAVGDVRYDTTDFLSYRRRVAGAGTTRPGLDGTNWQQVSGTGNVTLNGGPLAGLRNLIINGNFAINQRGYVSGTATTGANQYTLDRWRIVVSGQAATFTALGNGNLVTAPAGGLEQVIEGASIGGGTYVINWVGTATCTVGGTARAKGATFTLTAGTNVTVRFSGGTVDDVQIEPGTVVTAFEARPIGLEVFLCQRYYLRTDVHWRWDGSLGGAATLSVHVDFATPMRAAPTVSVVSSDNTNLTQGGISATVDGFESALVANNGGTIESRILRSIYQATAEL